MNKAYNFFFDIDDTLLCRGKSELSATVVESLRYARAKGCKVFINTGRTKASLPYCITSLDCFDGFLCGCGTYIEVGGKAILEHYVDKDEAYRLACLFEKHGLNSNLVLEGRDNIYYMGERFKAFAAPSIFIPFLKPRELYEKFGDMKINKCTIQPLTDKDSLFLDEICEDYDLMQCHNYWEIIAHGYGKGKAIALTESLLGLDADMSVAVGDSANDIEMLKYAKTSVAVGNATDEVKAICDIITDTAANDGVAKLIYSLVR